MRSLALISVLVLSTVTTAQTGSFTAKGAGCGGAAKGTRVSAPAAPKIGANFTVNVSVPLQPCCLPLLQWQTFMAIGVSDLVWAGGLLPYQFPGTQCNLHISPDVIMGKMQSGSCCPPRDSFTAPIPNDTSLIGKKFYVQWVQAQSSRGDWWSNYAECVIGT